MKLYLKNVFNFNADDRKFNLLVKKYDAQNNEVTLDPEKRVVIKGDKDDYDIKKGEHLEISLDYVGPNGNGNSDGIWIHLDTPSWENFLKGIAGNKDGLNWRLLIYIKEETTRGQIDHKGKNTILTILTKKNRSAGNVEVGDDRQ